LYRRDFLVEHSYQGFGLVYQVVGATGFAQERYSAQKWEHFAQE
jgi:hypothetical protein